MPILTDFALFSGIKSVCLIHKSEWYLQHKLQNCSFRETRFSFFQNKKKGPVCFEMKYRFLFLVLILISCSFGPCVAESKRIRPRAISVSPDKQWVATANRIAGTVMLVSLQEQRVISEIDLGREPLDIAWLDKNRIAVSLHRDRSVSILSLVQGKLQLIRQVGLPAYPYGMVFAQKARRLLVTLHHPDEIIAIDTETWQSVKHYKAGAYPRFLLLSPDEKWFVATSELPGSIYCFNLKNGKLLSRQILHGKAFNLGKPAFLSPGKIVLPTTINRDFPVTAGNISRGWVVNNRVVTFNVPHGNSLEQRKMNLDIRGHGVADLTVAATNDTQDKLVVLASGAHEAIILKPAGISWPTSDPDDFAPNHLSEKPGLLQRIKLGGRPIDLEFLSDDRAVIANELDDSLQIVDLNNANLLATIPLQSRYSNRKVSRHEFLIAKGERIFFDGKRSRDGWLSCHTCHFDGHTSGHLFDTLNDATYETKKLTLSLHNVSETEPWTWHGWQPDLTEAIAKSLRDTMHRRQPATREDILALTAYIETLRPISPFKEFPESQPAIVHQGYKLFQNKAGCSNCHQPPNFTAGQRYGVSRVESASIYQELNPPGLLGLSTRRHYLHHGRAHSLKQLLKLYHRPEDTSGETLTEKELNALMAFLSVL